MHQVTDTSHPLQTIEDPNGVPYISVIDEGQTIKIQLHTYEYDVTPLRPIFLVLDKRALPRLIEILNDVTKG